MYSTFDGETRLKFTISADADVIGAIEDLLAFLVDNGSDGKCKFEQLGINGWKQL
jgi:hypothetical protein